ncbi:hypothetical protein ACFSZS_11810 [Seohaeicola zhoushanensis]
MSQTIRLIAANIPQIAVASDMPSSWPNLSVLLGANTPLAVTTIISRPTVREDFRAFGDHISASPMPPEQASTPFRAPSRDIDPVFSPPVRTRQASRRRERRRPCNQDGRKRQAEQAQMTRLAKSISGPWRASPMDIYKIAIFPIHDLHPSPEANRWEGAPITNRI